MPVPSYRVPVRVARGTKAALDSGLASLEEGELCYATDENALYVVEGGVLTVAGSASGISSIDDLSDVDTTTVAPTDGQVLAWSSVDGEWQPGEVIPDIVTDTTPQLGGSLDVNGYYISSTSNGNVEIAPNGTGDFVVRGNSVDGKITLNCTNNNHGVTIQAPPHADAATYTLILPSSIGTAGQVLTSQGGAQLTWENPAASNVAAIDDLSDVDTSTTAPTSGQVLVWDGSNWIPSDQTGGGSSSGAYLTEAQTASGGTADFTGLGYSGILQKVSSSLDAWIVLYSSSAARTADASRAYDTDPDNSSGVLFEAYVTAGSTIVATPGTTYFNNDATPTEALYAAVRDQSGAAVNSEVTFYAYGSPDSMSDYISLATLKTEVAAATDFADFQSRIAAL